jgi:hypothetical protein
MTKDELLWEVSVAADRWRESKLGLKRFEDTMAECWHQCPPDNHPQAPRSDGGIGYDYTQCPIHGPVLDELDRQAVDMLAAQEFES